MAGHEGKGRGGHVGCDQLPVAEHHWAEAPHGQGKQCPGAAVELPAPAIHSPAADECEGNAGEPGEGHEKKRSTAVGVAEILAEGHFRAGARTAIETLPVGLAASGHDGQGSHQPHQRRVHGIDVEAIKHPVADAGDEVARLVERGALRGCAPREDGGVDDEKDRHGHAFGAGCGCTRR